MDNLLKNLVSQNSINGGSVWDRKDGSIYNPIGFSTIDFLSVIGDMKIKNLKNSIVNNAIDKVIGFYDSKTTQFKYSEKSSKLPCVSAKIVSLIQKLNIDFPELENCYQFFLNTQLDDGGWRCATVKMGKSPETDASNPGTTLYILDAFRYRDNSPTEKKQLDNGVEFLLRHWLTRKPLGPCQFGIGTTFMKTEYPFVRYNIFYFLYVLSFYEKALGDSRFKEMIDILFKKQTSSGIEVENPHKKWKAILYKEKHECDLANNKYYEIKENLKSSILIASGILPEAHNWWAS